MLISYWLIDLEQTVSHLYTEMALHNDYIMIPVFAYSILLMLLPF